MGLSVETFLKLQDECMYGKDMSPEQKEWSKIKEWIHEMVPVTMTREPQNCFLRVVYKMFESYVFRGIGGMFMAVYIIAMCLYGFYPQY